MKLPQNQTIWSLSALQESDVYFGLFTNAVKAAESDYEVNFPKREAISCQDQLF